MQCYVRASAAERKFRNDVKCNSGLRVKIANSYTLSAMYDRECQRRGGQVINTLSLFKYIHA